MKDYNLIVFSAPSGSGKTTLVKHILKLFPDFVFSISATTRPKREKETNGIEYYFLSEKEFEEKIKNNEFVEWERFYDYYYGTLKKLIEEKIEQNKVVIFELDVKGALNLKKIYSDSVLIFISPPNFETLEQRLIERATESKMDLQKRLERAKLEMSFKDKFDYIVINDNLEKAQKEVLEIIKKEIN
ncbi:MAG: guanylate kinase [Ignavibacteriales bacterium]|nr:guanylate kinase [Ignavibacteriales bacterium]